MMADFLFVALSTFALGGALTMLFVNKTIHSALGLMITILSVAGLFALLSASFLFVVQIIVYAGAIMTLIVFILMFLNVGDENIPSEPNKNKYIAITAVLLIPLNVVILKAVSNLEDKDMSIIDGTFGSIKEIGLILYYNWLVSFELISILLLVALIGAVVLAKKKKKIIEGVNP
jgi:NADH-quinone oxidoreductase subunit J